MMQVSALPAGEVGHASWKFFRSSSSFFVALRWLDSAERLSSISILRAIRRRVTTPSTKANGETSPKKDQAAIH